MTALVKKTSSLAPHGGSTTPILAAHPAQRRIEAAGEARARGDFATARVALDEAALCFALQPLDGSEAALVKARKVLWMEERAAKVRAQIENEKQLKLLND